MSTLPTEPSDTDEWHRKFAASCNNRAWDLSVAKRTIEEDSEMLDAAHAAAWHWAKVGSELNRMRATMLLAAVHASLGNGALAFRYAEQMRPYFLSRGDPDWEMAFTHVVYAHAAYAASRCEIYEAAYRQAETTLNAIADEEDRAIVAASFKQVPRP